jgi:hypothetical protein
MRFICFVDVIQRYKYKKGMRQHMRLKHTVEYEPSKKRKSKKGKEPFKKGKEPSKAMEKTQEPTTI